MTAHAQAEVRDLEALVLAGDVGGVAAACEAGTPPSNRTALVATCKQILGKGFWSMSMSAGYTGDQVDAAAVASTSHATITEVRAIRTPWKIPRDLDLAFRLVRARDESFRDGWAAHAIESLDARGAFVARRLIASGASRKPPSDAYTIALVSRPGAFDLTAKAGAWGRKGVIDVLRANPDLLIDDVWRIFEVEGGGENSLAAHDKYCAESGSWRAALVELSNEGALSRERLLDASLDALQRGFGQFRAQWYSAFHEALKPTDDERAARASTYLSLTASPVGPTVSMALKALLQVERATRLDAVEVVAQIGPAVLAPSKGSATQALGLLERAVASEPDLRPRAASLVAEALGHGSADVQKVALEKLRAWFPTPPEDLAAPVRSLAPGCHPSVRSAIDSWLGVANTSVAGPSPKPAWSPRAVKRSMTEVEWLGEDRKLTPIVDVADLFERIAASLETPGGADELELLVGGLAATGHGAVAQQRQALTLGRRATKLSRSDRPSQRLIARLVVAWTTREHLEATPPDEPAATLALDELLCRRIELVERQVRTGPPFTPIAAPTHRHGVIDPVVFVERLAAASAAPHPVELTTALLRLAPDVRRLREARSGLRGHERVARWLEGWAEHCERDASREAGWSASSWTASSGSTYHDLHVDGLDAITPRTSPLTVTLVPGRWRRFAQDAAGVEWMGSIIPGLPGAWARIGASTIGPTYGIRDVAHGDPAYLERFFDAEAPLSGDAQLLVALALNDQRASVRTVAVDLCVATFGDGRLVPCDLGSQIGRLASTGLVTAARWGPPLADVAAASPGHRRAVLECVQRAVAVAQPRKPQDLLTLLELFETLALETAGAVGDEAARSALTALTGTSKTGRTAARLLALEST